MARTLNKLKALAINRELPKGRHSDGGGLYLSVSVSGSKSWVFMWARKLANRKTKRHEVGLGSYPAVSLEAARKAAQEARELIAQGNNPLEARSKNVRKPFSEVADEYIDRTKSQWTNEKHEYQWRQTLGKYCEPIRALPIGEIDTEEMLTVLKPIWLEKHETATRLRARIERVIDYANEPHPGIVPLFRH